mmetsp:Transcript_47388/g.121978  ORF Transcript_47388/g.121978 Transcript_47388/m.121978 type:complete len:642 (+) Transcript_47388:212-2137(+)
MEDEERWLVLVQRLQHTFLNPVQRLHRYPHGLHEIQPGEALRIFQIRTPLGFAGDVGHIVEAETLVDDAVLLVAYVLEAREVDALRECLPAAVLLRGVWLREVREEPAGGLDVDPGQVRPPREQAVPYLVLHPLAALGLARGQLRADEASILPDQDRVVDLAVHDTVAEGVARQCGAHTGGRERLARLHGPDALDQPGPQAALRADGLGGGGGPGVLVVKNDLRIQHQAVLRGHLLVHVHHRGDAVPLLPSGDVLLVAPSTFGKLLVAHNPGPQAVGHVRIEAFLSSLEQLQVRLLREHQEYGHGLDGRRARGPFSQQPAHAVEFRRVHRDPCRHALRPPRRYRRRIATGPGSEAGLHELPPASHVVPLVLQKWHCGDFSADQLGAATVIDGAWIRRGHIGLLPRDEVCGRVALRGAGDVGAEGAAAAGVGGSVAEHHVASPRKPVAVQRLLRCSRRLRRRRRYCRCRWQRCRLFLGRCALCDPRCRHRLGRRRSLQPRKWRHRRRGERRRLVGWRRGGIREVRREVLQRGVREELAALAAKQHVPEVEYVQIEQKQRSEHRPSAATDPKQLPPPSSPRHLLSRRLFRQRPRLRHGLRARGLRVCKIGDARRRHGPQRQRGVTWRPGSLQSPVLAQQSGTR